MDCWNRCRARRCWPSWPTRSGTFAIVTCPGCWCACSPRWCLSQWCLELLFWIEPGDVHGIPWWWALLQVVVLLAVVFILFGWISRRFERQADTFAVQHLTRLQPGREEMTSSSVEAMSDALGSIAALQAVDPGRRSWRHGSIAWRCGYLHTLVGQHAGQLVIDRVMVAIRLASAIIIVLAILQLILDGAT